MVFQNTLANYSFLTLLSSMILYWIETAFPGFFKNNLENKSIAKYGILISNILLSALLIIRWKESGHFPLSNLYESLMFLSWCFTALHLYIENSTLLGKDIQTTPYTLEVGVTSSGLAPIKKKSNNITYKLLGAITTPSALLTNAFAAFTLPKEMQEAAPLVPALQSNWLMMHVTVMVLSYAALILGSLLSIAFLILSFNFSNDDISNFSFEKDSIKTEFNIETSLQIEKKTENLKSTNNLKYQTIASELDNLSYRILGLGFPLLTIGILSGAVWANEAWGSYWSWDPKETWALLTWLVFAIYLHTRISKGWEGKKPALIASFGFVVVWVCYLGVNLIGEGLHSYGWVLKA
jgi:cytochrome c-type biogenesis protein CcsB